MHDTKVDAYTSLYLCLCQTSSISCKTHIYNQMMFVLFGRTSGKDCKTLLSEEKPRAWHKSIHIQASWRPATNRENLPSILQKISHPLWHEIRRIAEICHRFLGKSATDFGEIRHRLWEKSATDFRKICHRLWENQPPPGL